MLLRLCRSAWTRQAAVDKKLWQHDVTAFTGTLRMTQAGLAGQVGIGVANFTAKPLVERIQTLITWIQYADMMASLISAKRRQFLLMEMRVDTTEAVDDGAEDEPLATQAKLVCQSTLM
jgi:hypothetical protein